MDLFNSIILFLSLSFFIVCTLRFTSSRTGGKLCKLYGSFPAFVCACVEEWMGCRCVCDEEYIS